MSDLAKTYADWVGEVPLPEMTFYKYQRPEKCPSPPKKREAGESELFEESKMESKQESKEEIKEEAGPVVDPSLPAEE